MTLELCGREVLVGFLQSGFNFHAGERERESVGVGRGGGGGGGV